MGFILGVITRLIKWTLYLAIFAAVIIFIPNLPPYTKFTSIENEPTQATVGPLKLNGDLNNAEQLYKDKLLGAEAFQIWNGEVYSGLATGEIVKISPGGHVTFVTKIGLPCTGLSQEHICGRPLGFKIDERNNMLYVADAYHGIWKVDLKTDKKQLLVSPRLRIEGTKPKLFNDLSLGKNGDLYWTDSCGDFHLKDGAYCLIADPSGRLFHYNAAKNQSVVLLEDLWFPNGVVVSPDNQFLVVSETGRYRLLKYYIDGPKKGKSEVFVAGLPGTPDNLRALPDGSGVLAALYTVFDENHPLLTKSMAGTPHLRKLIARIFRLVEIPFEFLHSQYPNVVFEDIVYQIGNFRSMSGLRPDKSGLVQLDWNGNIVASYYNTDKSLGTISDAIVYNDKLYIGSPHENYIGVVPAPALLKKAFASTQTKKAETVTTEPPKPKVDRKPVDPPKQKVQEKVQEKQKTVKVAKPVIQEPPKPKPAEPKPTTHKPETKPSTPKPVETQPKVEPRASQAPKPTTPPPKQPENKPATPKAPPSKPTTPEKTKPTTPPKQAEPKPEKATLKPAQSPPEDVKAKKTSETKSQEKPKSADKPVPEQIPITEEIPSDTAKPTKETLKVIKKGGPTEIPNPNL